MLTHIHHINFVVSDLSTSVAYFSNLLQQQPTIESLPRRHINTARFKIGETFLVLVEPTAEGVVSTILEKKGEGIFLISFATQSIEETIRELELTYAQDRDGINGWSICDISPMEQFGAILQLTQSAH